MAPRLLIINCASPYFFYIPMGSFGLCDYLAQRGLAARIFNPALYPEAEAEVRLEAVLEDFQPTHVGFVLHWQETAHGLAPALAAVRAWHPEVVTLCGGFTASCFAKDLLTNVPGLDYVVTGDPEVPVEQLLQAKPPATIPNLIWREQGRIQRSKHHWLMEGPLLDTLSFAGLGYLVDRERYLAKINTKLGFPLFLGRGCVFDCAYCGGSRHAFRQHSGRHHPAVRSISAVLNDLHALKDRTRLLYLCYENDPQLVRDLLAAIGEDPELRGHFRLYYGAWHLLDAEFIQAYQAAFACEPPPLFEFSPEVYDDARRGAIKRGPTYTMDGLLANIREIHRAFQGRVRIELFFSRYHPDVSLPQLRQEIREICRLKHHLVRAGLDGVRVLFDHLSTDVGSRYWAEQIDQPHQFATLLTLKQGVDEGSLHPFPVDNLCLFVPGHLADIDCLRIEALLLVLERLEYDCREVYHLLFAWWDDRWLEALEALLIPWITPERRADFFAAPPLKELVAALGVRLADSTVYGAAPPFLADLVRFSGRKLARPTRAGSGAVLPGPDEALVLDPERVAIHEQDYLDLAPLIARLSSPDVGPLGYQRTVFFFLAKEIFSLPQALYRASFRCFEEPRTLAEYQALLERRQPPAPEQLATLLQRLLAEGVLRPAAWG